MQNWRQETNLDAAEHNDLQGQAQVLTGWQFGGQLKQLEIPLNSLGNRVTVNKGRFDKAVCGQDICARCGAQESASKNEEIKPKIEQDKYGRLKLERHA